MITTATVLFWVWLVFVAIASFTIVSSNDKKTRSGFLFTIPFYALIVYAMSLIANGNYIAWVFIVSTVYLGFDIIGACMFTVTYEDVGKRIGSFIRAIISITTISLIILTMSNTPVSAT